MTAKSAEAKIEYPHVEPGERCPCCSRKVPKNARTLLTDEERKERQREYHRARRQRLAAEKAELEELRKLVKTETDDASGRLLASQLQSSHDKAP